MVRPKARSVGCELENKITEAEQLLSAAIPVKSTVTSSRTKLVCRFESSTPVKATVTVCPAYDDRSNERSWYPDAAFTFEYVASVLPAAETVSLSYAVEPYSSVSTCSQKFSFAVAPV